MSAPRLRNIPAVDKVLQQLEPCSLPRPVVVDCVRSQLASLRRQKKVPAPDAILEQINRALAALEQSRIQPVINGTGVLIHTNLGRSPLGSRVMETLQTIGSQYNNLEFDLASGSRGSRGSYLEHCLALLCHAEAATVVNNCAAALLLALRHFTAKKPEVIISRGELVQIGGGFRIPDILETSGARLREVGTTNKTSLKDYEKAVGPDTALLLKVHRSNFFMEGFVESPATAELAALAKHRRVPLIEDLGSGAMVPMETFSGLEHEPTPAESLKQGVDLVLFSGDKLLGGPQAGIIAGKRKWVSALKRNPMFRALRCDKLILAGLQVLAEQYLETATPSVPYPSWPVLSMLSEPVETLQKRAHSLSRSLANLPVKATIASSKAQMGGGTLPRARVPSVTLELAPQKISAKQLSEQLRTGVPPVIGMISGSRLKLDLRTIFPHQDKPLATRLRTVLNNNI